MYCRRSVCLSVCRMLTVLWSLHSSRNICSINAPNKWRHCQQVTQGVTDSSPEKIFVLCSSDVAILTPVASNNNDRPWQKLRTSKKTQLFIELLFIWFNNLKFVEHWEFFFIYNINFVALWTLPPRVPASHPPSPFLTYATAKFLRCDLYINALCALFWREQSRFWDWPGQFVDFISTFPVT